jgi:membrane-bound lytic murein transglycosylase
MLHLTRVRPAALCAASLLVLALLAACQQSPPAPQPTPEPFAGSAGAASPTASEAERTRQMEERAAAATTALQAAQQGNLSEAESLEAYRQFEREKKALDAMAEGQAGTPPPQP